MNNIIYLIIAAILMLPGIIGVLIPVLPGIPYMFVIAIVYGLVTKFQTLNTTEIIVLLSITILSLAVDYLSGILGAKYGGASKKSLVAGFIGLIVGTIVFPPFGGIVGLFLAIYLAEYLTHYNQQRANEAAKGGLIGTISGISINLLLSIAFLIFFILVSLK